MKKKTVANLIMVAVILVIAAAGILGVGHIQGWFDTADGTQAVLENIQGVIHLMRDGVSYPVENTTVLRTGDKLTCQNGATAVICLGEDTITIGEKAVIAVANPLAEHFQAEIFSGEVFAHCDGNAEITFDSNTVTILQSTAHISVRSGAQSVSVFRGSVGQADAGQILNYINDSVTVGELALSSLNDFAITQIRNLDDTSLCFTLADLDDLAQQRQQAMQELLDSQIKPTTPSAEPTEPADPELTQPSTEIPTPSTEPTELPKATTSTEAAEPEETSPPEPTEAPETAPPAPASSCTIAIYCDTILDNMGDLEPGKSEFVPSNGVILYPVTVEFSDGETVFDVLKRVCSMTGIQLEYSWTPLYNSYYIEGINNLYEFDCGFESGWMYKVNGWFPNYGCSSYSLKDGDVIVWAYTCKGLGTDVGAPRMD